MLSESAQQSMVPSSRGEIVPPSMWLVIKTCTFVIGATRPIFSDCSFYFYVWLQVKNIV